MSYVFPYTERGLHMDKYFSKPNVPSLANETTWALRQYFAKYEKEAKTYKYYDGIAGDEIFPALKKMSKRYPKNKRIRRALKDAIRDRKLTKAFYKPSLLFKTLEGYFEPDPLGLNNYPYLEKAKKRMIEQIVPSVKLKPKLIKRGMNVNDNLSTLNTSAGIVNYGKKKKHVQKYMIERGLELKQLVASGKSFFKIPVAPYIALTRSQLGILAYNLDYVAPIDENGEYKYKSRLVWCEDSAMVLFESQYARPLIDYCAYAWPNIAMGKSPEYLRSMLCEMSETKSNWYSSDYSKYDSSIAAQLIRIAFDIIKMCFDEEYHREIDFICSKFIHADILMPDGRVYSVNKGIKSGSYFTQMIGSICNGLILFTFLEHKYDKYEAKKRSKFDGIKDIDTTMRLRDGRYSCNFMGDDSVFAIDDNIDYTAFSKFVKKVFNVNINVEKSAKGKQNEWIDYLKRQWTRQGEWRDPADLMINIMHPERKRKYDNYSPWHILFGYFVTYRRAMESMGFSARYIVENMKKTPFGIEAFENVEREELPGALASLRHSDYQLYRAIVDNAYELAQAEDVYEQFWEDAV